MVPPVVWLLLQGRYEIALWLFFIAGVTDAVDGFLAKTFNWESQLGGILDPLADKLLLVSSMVSLGMLGLLPVWLIVLVLLRDVVIVSGAVAYHFRVAKFEAEPSLVSKTNTLAQILLVLSAIGSQVIDFQFDMTIKILIAVVVLTIVISGVDYVVTWGRRAKQSRINRS